MSNKDRFKMFVTCDSCHKEVMEKDCFRLVYDLLHCPECYENIVHEGRLALNEGGPVRTKGASFFASTYE